MARTTWGFPGFGIRGRVGGLEFFTLAGGDTRVREVPTVRAARTPAQRASEARLKRVGAAWRDLGPEELAAWARWAEPAGVQTYNAFSALAAKCLQMRPDEPVPRLPPTAEFLGDGVVVTVTGSLPLGRGRGGVESVSAECGSEEAGGDPTPAPPQGEGIPGITFSASGPNSQGVVTELLTQPLARASRKPRAKEYTSRGFVSFTGGSLAVAVPCGVGAWACAFRFVRWDTGQETAFVPLGTVTVEG